MSFFEKIKRKRALKQEVQEKHPGYKVRVKTNKFTRDFTMKSKGWKAAADEPIESAKDTTAIGTGHIEQGKTLSRATAWIKPKTGGKPASSKNTRTLGGVTGHLPYSEYIKKKKKNTKK